MLANPATYADFIQPRTIASLKTGPSIGSPKSELNVSSFKISAVAVALLAPAVLGASTSVSAQSYTGTTSGYGQNLEGALGTFRGNAHSACTRMMSGRPAGFDFTITEARATGSVPPYVVRGTFTCNGSQPISREEFIRRATPR